MAKPKKKDEEIISEDNRAEETPEERKERKAAEPRKVPVAKAKTALQRPDIKSLYPWALNRRKAETAHIAVHRQIVEEGGKVSSEDAEQRVMDHYTLHGGLVRNQEKVTVVGRRKPIKPGATTDDIVNDVDTEDDDSDD